ncbi:MAG: NUDIX hydrolase [Nanoarchaeota archaeon]|nr:NUDIX hydrolase [Nanoarchaeota archaeon]
MIIEKPSKYFKSDCEVVGGVIEHDGKILLLHRQDHKPEGNTWGGPSGKIESNETPEKAVIREIKEETGIKIGERQLKSYGKLFVHYPNYDFIYYLFYIKLENLPEIKIENKEHKNFIWVRPEEALKMNLIEDEDFCIKQIFKI